MKLERKVTLFNNLILSCTIKMANIEPNVNFTAIGRLVEGFDMSIKPISIQNLSDYEEITGKKKGLLEQVRPFLDTLDLLLLEQSYRGYIEELSLEMENDKHIALKWQTSISKKDCRFANSYLPSGTSYNGYFRYISSWVNWENLPGEHYFLLQLEQKKNYFNKGN